MLNSVGNQQGILTNNDFFMTLRCSFLQFPTTYTVNVLSKILIISWSTFELAGNELIVCDTIFKKEGLEFHHTSLSRWNEGAMHVVVGYRDPVY